MVCYNCNSDCLIQLHFVCGLTAVPDGCATTWYYSTNDTGPYYQLEETFKKVSNSFSFYGDLIPFCLSNHKKEILLFRVPHEP